MQVVCHYDQRKSKPYDGSILMNEQHLDMMVVHLREQPMCYSGLQQSNKWAEYLENLI